MSAPPRGRASGVTADTKGILLCKGGEQAPPYDNEGAKGERNIKKDCRGY